MSDVEEFTNQLVLEGLTLGFHPDTDFTQYIRLNTEGQRSYTDEDASVRNKLMEQCFDVCERANEDIYAFTGRITLRDTPFETMFDENHEEKYAEYMRQVEANERVWGYPKNLISDINIAA